jgi:hypothetical protein
VWRNEFTDLAKNGTLTPGCAGWHIDNLLVCDDSRDCSQSVSHYKFLNSDVGMVFSFGR